MEQTKRTLPSDLAQVLVVLRYDLLKHLRSKRIYGVIALLGIILALSLAIPPLTGNDFPDSASEFTKNFVGFVTTIVIIIATLFAGDAIVSEFQGRTGYLLFPNPVKRWSLYLGKYLAAFLLAVVLLGIYYLIFVFLGLAITGDVSDKALWSFLLACLFAAATIAFGFLVSSLLKGSTGSLILTFATLLLIMPMIAGLMGLTSTSPVFLLSFCGGAAEYVTYGVYPVDYQGSFGTGMDQMTFYNHFPPLDLAIGVMVAYTVVCFLLGYLLFQRREMVS